MARIDDDTANPGGPGLELLPLCGDLRATRGDGDFL